MTNLGSKFECSECETKFYDLAQDQALCPQCGHEMTKEDPLKSKPSSRKRAAAPKAKKAKAKSKPKSKAKAKDADKEEE